jgi:PAS domain S-box-containing protein
MRSDSQLFYNAFKASPIGIALENMEGRPLFVNSALCSMLGFSEEEMRGKHCVEFSPSEDAEKDWALFEQLRAGSIDHYDIEKRFFRRDGSLVWGRLSISLLKDPASPMVIAMVEDITAKKMWREKPLRALDDLEVVMKGLTAAISRCGGDFRYQWANQRYADWLQRPLEEIVGRPILDVLGEEAFETLRHHFERVLAGENVSYEEEVNFQGIGRRWISAAYTPTFGADAVANGWLAVVVDITDRKLAEEARLRPPATERELAEEALSTASQRLIQAQEQECSRLARELHDDISQRLAMLAVNLEVVKRGLPDSADELGRQIGEVHEQVVAVGKEIQALSHRLHSPKLELLGLAATASSFCKEFSDQKKVEIEFQSESIPKELPQEIALCLFRVLQEALQNAVKHSGSRRLQVSLRGGESKIELTVQDSGVGFEPEAAIKGPGLGLTSMKERLKLVDGQLSIDSKLQGGTTIHARVPFNPKRKSAGAIR